MTTIDQQIASFRAELLRQDRAAQADLTRAYAALAAQLATRISQLAARIDATRSAGEPVTPSWLDQLAELRLLLADVDQLFRSQLAPAAERIITSAQREAITLALSHARDLLRTEAGPGASIRRLGTEAFTDLVGALADGTPLADLLAELGPAAADAIREALIASVGRGEGPAVISRQIRDALGGSLTRALRIARTEPFRALRSASLRTYRANADLVSGWVWVAALQPQTCPVCWAMHGQVFPLEVPFASHVLCRCSPAPVLRGRPSPVAAEGAILFARQPADVQRQILGAGKFDLYQAGRLELRDLVDEREHPRWGPSRTEKSLRALGGRQP